MQIFIWIGCTIVAIWMYLLSFRFNLWAWDGFIEIVVGLFHRTRLRYEVEEMGKLAWLGTFCAVLCFVPGSGILALAIALLETLIRDFVIPILVFVLNCLLWAPTGVWPIIKYEC